MASLRNMISGDRPVAAPVVVTIMANLAEEA